MIEVIFIGSIFFSLGFGLGLYLKAQAWYSEDWIFLRWNTQSLGYRPMPTGSLIKKGDDVIMSLAISTSHIPEEGVIVE